MSLQLLPLPEQEKIKNLVVSYPLATIIVQSENNLQAHHIPMHLVTTPEGRTVLQGHIARANPPHQPIGFALPNWQPCLPPEATVLIGRTCRLEPLDPARHADDLCHAFLQPEAATVWTYLPSGPFSATQSDTFRQHLADISGQADPLHFAVIDQQTQQAIGSVALMRIDATNGVAEIGAVTFSPQLQRTTAATEAHFLLLHYLFDTLGYRRCEWKCDQLNAPSKKAATRLGFQFEGLFRQILVYKGRNRDTAWHSIIDSEWPAIRAALICWLAPDNFTADGQQKKSLAHFKTDAGTE